MRLISIEIGTQTYVVDAHHLDGMLQMGNGIHDVCLALLAQESVIERSMKPHLHGLPGHASDHRVRLRGTSQSARLLLWLHTIGV